MLFLNSGAGQFTGEHTHLEGENHALLSGHSADNRILDGLRFGSRVTDGHGKMVPRGFVSGLRFSDAADVFQI